MVPLCLQQMLYLGTRNVGNPYEPTRFGSSARGGIPAHLASAGTLSLDSCSLSDRLRVLVPVLAFPMFTNIVHFKTALVKWTFKKLEHNSILFFRISLFPIGIPRIQGHTTAARNLKRRCRHIGSLGAGQKDNRSGNFFR